TRLTYVDHVVAAERRRTRGAAAGGADERHDERQAGDEGGQTHAGKAYRYRESGLSGSSRGGLGGPGRPSQSARAAWSWIASCVPWNSPSSQPRISAWASASSSSVPERMSGVISASSW